MLEGDLGAVPPTLLAEVHSAAGFASDLAVNSVQPLPMRTRR